MDFGRKCIIFVLAKRREPIYTGLSPLFLPLNQLFYLGDRKNTSEIVFFLGVIRKFLGQLFAIIADVEPRNVKRYLFSQGADLTFQGSPQVVARQ